MGGCKVSTYLRSTSNIADLEGTKPSGGEGKGPREGEQGRGEMTGVWLWLSIYMDK